MNENTKHVLAILVSILTSVGASYVLITPREGPIGPQGNQGIQGEQGPIGPIYTDTREWHLAYGFWESESWMIDLDAQEELEVDAIEYTSEVFEVQGRELRLRWNAEPITLSAEIRIYVMFTNGTRWAVRMSSGRTALASDMRIIPGEYYLEVRTWRMSFFSVNVWDYY